MTFPLSYCDMSTHFTHTHTRAHTRTRTHARTHVCMHTTNFLHSRSFSFFLSFLMLLLTPFLSSRTRNIRIRFHRRVHAHVCTCTYSEYLTRMCFFFVFLSLRKLQLCNYFRLEEKATRDEQAKILMSSQY